MRLGIIKSVAVLVCILSGLVSGLVFNGTDNGHRTQCKLDDLQHQFLEPKAENAFLTIVEGACSNRPRDEALTLGPSSNPGTRVDFNQIDNRLSGPSCIGLIANTDANDVEPVAIFYDSNLTEIGRIVLTRSSINVTVRSSFASFGFPEQSTQDHSRLQLCMDGVKMELYHDCLLVGSEPFVSGGFQESDVIGLLRHLVTENAPPYLNSVAQFYLISCSGPGVETEDIVDLQCRANPPNCSESVVALSEVVSSYVMRLGTEVLPQPSIPTPLPHSSSSSTVMLHQLSTLGTRRSDSQSGTATPTLMPTVKACECRVKEREIETLRSALIAVSTVCGCVILVLLAVVIAVCVLWTQAVR